MTGRRAGLARVAVPLVAALALVLSAGWLLLGGNQATWAQRAWATDGTGADMMGGAGMMGSAGMMGGAGMMGSAGMMGGAGMMGFGLPGDGREVSDLESARTRAQTFADQLGSDLRVGEVMQFANHYYAEIVTAAGTAATEVLVDPRNGAVSIEPGPAMMWNTQYGMAWPSASGAELDATEAQQAARQWLQQAGRTVTVGEAEAFPGYYTMHTLDDGRVDGMLSVHATTGVVWYHGWHGRFVDMAEPEE